MKRLLIFILLIAGLPALSAQSNEVLDRFLSGAEADTRIAAYLVLLSAELISEEDGPETAGKYIGDQPWGSEVLKEDSLNYGRFAMMTMEILDIPGGLFYRLFPSPRYAAREFSYRKFIPGRAAPGDMLTPLEVITGLNAAVEWKEAEQ